MRVQDSTFACLKRFVWLKLGAPRTQVSSTLRSLLSASISTYELLSNVFKLISKNLYYLKKFSLTSAHL